MHGHAAEDCRPPQGPRREVIFPQGYAACDRGRGGDRCVHGVHAILRHQDAAFDRVRLRAAVQSHRRGDRSLPPRRGDAAMAGVFQGGVRYRVLDHVQPAPPAPEGANAPSETGRTLSLGHVFRRGNAPFHRLALLLHAGGDHLLFRHAEDRPGEAEGALSVFSPCGEGRHTR